MVCNFCKQPILDTEARVSFKRFQTLFYDNYHNRHNQDCWFQKDRQLVRQTDNLEKLREAYRP
jgi:hypothetical protein